ncbi:MAG TPA: ribosome maturation factor RimM, partial [Hyphomicrobiaceae bacterium]|nr:ribosome maturation factor RimM [Hyphomicrobiaceae bacterium]
MSSASRVLLGRIGRAHGLRGEVAVESYTRDPRDIASYGPLSDDDGNKRLVLTIVGTRENSVIARIEGVTDRTAAEQLRGTALWIARSALPPPEPGAYYHVDLIGLMATLPDGAELGRVAAVENFGAG